MRSNVKYVALFGAVCLAVSWTYADFQSGDSEDSPRLISVALSMPQNPLPGDYFRPVASPQPVHNGSQNTFRGTAWGGYFSEPYHYQCGGKTMAPVQNGYGCDACDFDPSANCVQRMFSLLDLLGHRHCTVLGHRHCTTCDSCDDQTCSACDDCSSPGTDNDDDLDDYYRDAPPQPEEDGDSMEEEGESKKVQQKPMDDPMDTWTPKKVEPPMPKKPDAVTPPRNRLPSSAQIRPRLILPSVPATFEHPQPQRPTKTTLRFRNSTRATPAEPSASIRLLSGEQR